MDPTEALPDDALANILRRLPPCDLAASRCVRKAWRALVDAHRLLLPHLLPHSLHGFFINYIDYERPRFFSRPSTVRPVINGNLDFLPHYSSSFNPIVDHCNGLMLYEDWRELYVVNPATRRWEELPREDRDCNAYLVFDPAVSSHYEMFFIPYLPKKLVVPEPKKLEKFRSKKKLEKSKNLGQFSGPYGLASLFSLPDGILEALDTEEDHFEDGSTESSPQQDSIQEGDSTTSSESSPPESRDKQEDPHDSMEWPPSLWTLNVFSSGSRQWQKRSFVRQGEAAGTVTNMRLDPFEPGGLGWGGPRSRYSVYWRGSLYVHCRGWFVVRLSLSDDKYQVIKMPTNIEASKHAQYLGKSEKGVYLATLHERYRLRVWTLVESSGQMDWVLKHYTDIESWATLDFYYLKGFNKTWILDDSDYNCNYSYNHYENDDHGDDDDDGGEGEGGEENREWNSDDDNVLNTGDDYGPFYSGINFLGFHPYKEVVFFELSSFTGVAYHLKSSKVQYLGKLRPKDYYKAHSNGLYESFPYTPCMIGELLRQAPKSRHRD